MQADTTQYTYAVGEYVCATFMGPMGNVLVLVYGKIERIISSPLGLRYKVEGTHIHLAGSQLKRFT